MVWLPSVCLSTQGCFRTNLVQKPAAEAFTAIEAAKYAIISSSMVGAPCATFCPPSTNPFPPRRKPFVILSSISTPFPSKPKKRKNHLRPKLIKTLPEPVISETSPTNSVIPFDSSQEPQSPVGKVSEGTQQLQSLTTGAAAGVVRGKFGNFSIRWVLFFFIGAFVFQAIRAVWVSGLVNSAKKDESLGTESGETRVSELGVDGDGDERSFIFLTGRDDPLPGRLWFREVGNGFVGGSEFEKKINEIKAMAWEARAKERLDSTGNVDSGKTGIELEVERELNSFRKIMPKSSDKAQKDGKKPGSIRFNDPFKGMSPSVGSDDRSITGIKNSSSAVEEGSIRNGSVDRDSVDLLEKGQKLGNSKANINLGNGNEVAKPESGNGSMQENGIQTHLVKGGSSSNSTIGSKQEGSKVEDRQSDDKADFWWLSLPYVLVIRYHDAEEAKGLFTLESKGDSCHTIIAFEDQGDASNFCYLLEPFLEDIGDSAEIVPFPTKELSEEVSSDYTKVIVVKKGQLKLYAGQPLEEVEMALRSLAQ